MNGLVKQSQKGEGKGFLPFDTKGEKEGFYCIF